MIGVALEEVTLAKLLTLLKHYRMVEGPARRLVMEEYYQDPRLLVEEVFAFYKSSKFPRGLN